MLVYTDNTKRDAEIADRLRRSVDANYHLDWTKKSRKILIIGNGFDLQAGLKSSFSDFILYIIYGCAFYQYKNLTERNLKKTFDKKEFESYIFHENYPKEQIEYSLKKQYQSSEEIWIKCHDFASSDLGKLLLKKIIPNFYSYLIDELHIVGSPYIPELHPKEVDPRLFAYGLSENKPSITSPVLFSNISSEVVNKKIGTFDYLLKGELKRNQTNINLWLDVETVIEMLVLKHDDLLKKYNFTQKEVEGLALDNYLKDLDLFEELLANYLKEEEKEKKDNLPQDFFQTITNDYSETLKNRSHLRISKVKLEEADFVINYNYTNIAKVLFKEQNNVENTAIIRHINGAIDVSDNLKVDEIDNNIVIGYTNLKGDDVSKDLFPFEKRSRRLIKNTDYINLNELINDEEFDLVIMGQSCGVADSDVISKLLSSNHLRSAVVLCYKLDALISTYNNIRSMLAPEVFDELMDHSSYRRNLYFSVRKTTKEESIKKNVQ